MADEKPTTTMAEDVKKEHSSTTTDGLPRSSAPNYTHTGTVDEAMKAFEAGDGEPIVLDEATNKRLLRRIDLHIMPLMCIVYGLNYLDKTTLSYANVMGLKKSIHLKGDDYQWLGSMFYFGTTIPIASTSFPLFPRSRLD